MSVVSVKARSFILALFIRDDGERFLLGDNGYDFKEKQLHFAGNNIENDEVAIQGADGVLLAGQVRRASVQSFDGYVGDGSVSKERIEQMRRDFIGFFAKGHHFRVIYIDCARNAWQRKGGYLVDAPEVKELWQIHPEYHVGLNFEDVNYYEYDEDAEGEEVLSNLFNLPISSAVEGGLVWDEDGAVSEDAETDEARGAAQSASGSFIELDLSSGYGRLDSATIKGNTSQSGTPTPDAPVPVQTVTGENVIQICGKNLFDKDTATLTYQDLTSAPTVGNTLPVANNNYCISVKYDISSLAGKTVALSSVITRFQRVRPAFLDSSSKLIQSLTAYGNPCTFTIPLGAKYIQVFINPSYGSTEDLRNIGFDELKLQIEKGSTATYYESFQGQSYKLNLGKNFVDSDISKVSQQSNATASASGNGISVAGSSSGGTHYAVLPIQNISKVLGKSVTASCKYSGSASRVTVYYLNSSGGATSYINELTLSGGSASKTFNMPASLGNNAGIGLVFYVDANATATYTDIQLELGSTATSYAAYFEPIELCKIGNYQDSIYKSGDKWYVHKEVGIANLPNDVSRADYNDNKGWAMTLTTGKSVGVGENEGANLVYCNKLKGGTRSQIYASTYNLVALPSTGTYYQDIFVNPSGTIGQGWNSSQFLTWLSNNAMILYYPLATPTDTEITNQALIAQLEALRTASLVSGENNIGFGVVAPNIAGELEISYYGYEIIVVAGGYIWEAGGSGGPTILINDSISNVMPIWTVFGPALNPQLENITTGSVIQYVGSVAQGQTLVVDMGEQTANLSGLNVISDMVGDWIDLAPGSNRMIYSADADNTPDSEIGWSDIVG